MREKLALLNVEDLKEIATKTGIEFTDGIDSLKDTPIMSVKEQLLSVLDESDEKDIEREYNYVVATKSGT